MFRTRFAADERGIEGLPIRLVVSLVVGVAALGVTELDTRPTPEVTAPGQQSVSVLVTGQEGRPVSNATVLARGDTARLDGVSVARTNASGVATFDLAPSLPANRADGTLRFEVKPPAGESQYVDRRENAGLLVVRGYESDGSAVGDGGDATDDAQ